MFPLNLDLQFLSENSQLESQAFFGAQDFAVEDPGLDPDDAVGRLGFGKTVVDESPQGMQRHPAFPVPFLPGNFRAGQTA